MANVEFRGVEKVYGVVRALYPLDLVIEDGRFVVLLGPSGCGKSTLLRLVAGLEEVTSGDLFIGGRRVNDLRPRDRNIAMVFQNFALYPHLTVAENIGFPLKVQRAPRDEIARWVKEVGSTLNLSDTLERKPKQLSGGERQRVALGRAMVREPEVFLLDEPLSNLDAKLREEMRGELIQLHAKLSATMIYVTHDQVEAMTMAEHIVVLCDGKVQQVGAPRDVYEHPANTFVARFIGSPSMNFLPGRLFRGTGGVTLVAGGATVTLPGAASVQEDGRDILVGIRPDELVFRQADELRDDDLALDLTVQSLQPLGHDLIIELAADNGDWTAVAETDWKTNRFQVGDRVRASVSASALHLFDAESGQRMPIATGHEADRGRSDPAPHKAAQ